MIPKPEKYLTQKVLLDNGNTLDIDKMASYGKTTMIFYKDNERWAFAINIIIRKPVFGKPTGGSQNGEIFQKRGKKNFRKKYEEKA